MSGITPLRPVTRRRCKDCARVGAHLITTNYDPGRLPTCQNHNTYLPAAFYEVFEPDEARRLIKHFEFHIIPKHGSWLNIAEIELIALSWQCLSQCIQDKAALQPEAVVW